MNEEKRFSPAILLMIVSAVGLAVIGLYTAATGKKIAFLFYQEVSGFDYRDFYWASQSILKGGSPYDIPIQRYVTTPLPALINTPLAFLNFETAYWIYFVLSAAATLAAYYLACSFFPIAEKRERELLLFGGVIFIAFSYPFFFLQERGNIDGLVLFFLMAGLYNIERRDWAVGLFFALAIFFKIYPGMLILPLLLMRRWRILAHIALFSVLLSLPILPWLPEFIDFITLRTTAGFRITENGSVVNFFVFFIMIVIAIFGWPSIEAIKFAPLFGGLFLSVFLTILIWNTFKRGKHTLHTSDFKFSFLLFIPYMLSMPQISYHYVLINLIILIPVTHHIMTHNTTRQARWIAAFFTLGLIFSQWHVIAYYRITGNLLTHGIPSLGLVFIMLAAPFAASLRFPRHIKTA